MARNRRSRFGHRRPRRLRDSRRERTDRYPWEILPDQSVCVLVPATQPRQARIREVDVFGERWPNRSWHAISVPWPTSQPSAHGRECASKNEPTASTNLRRSARPAEAAAGHNGCTPRRTCRSRDCRPSDDHIPLKRLPYSGLDHSETRIDSLRRGDDPDRIRRSSALCRRRRSGRQMRILAINLRHNHLSATVAQRLIDDFARHTSPA